MIALAHNFHPGNYNNSLPRSKCSSPLNLILLKLNMTFPITFMPICSAKHSPSNQMLLDYRTFDTQITPLEIFLHHGVLFLSLIQHTIEICTFLLLLNSFIIQNIIQLVYISVHDFQSARIPPRQLQGEKLEMIMHGFHLMHNWFTVLI